MRTKVVRFIEAGDNVRVGDEWELVEKVREIHHTNYNEMMMDMVSGKRVYVEINREVEVR